MKDKTSSVKENQNVFTCFSPMCLPDVVLCKRSNTLLVLGCSSFCWVGSSDDVIELKQKDQLQVSRMNTAVSTLEATRCYGGPYQRKIVADIFCIDGKIVPQCFFLIIIFSVQIIRLSRLRLIFFEYFSNLLCFTVGGGF